VRESNLPNLIFTLFVSSLVITIKQIVKTTKVCKNTGLKTIAQTIAISRFYLHWEKLNTDYVK